MKTENLIAYKGDITLEKAVWDNVSGMTVLFQLEQRPHELTAANPFKKFTKMRSGRVGTRFSAIIVNEGGWNYTDDMMLKGWNDGTAGWKVTFWLAGDERHPFMDFDKGSEFAMVVVELDDDETPIDQVKRDRVTTPRRKAPGLSNYAALLCRTETFWDYLDEKYESFDIDRKSGMTNEEAAKHMMCAILNVGSRAELDSDRDVAALFHEKIRGPYAEWNSERG